MGKITIDLDPAQDARIVAAFAKAHHYRAKLDDDSDNPETKRDFLIRKVKTFIRESAIQAEALEEAEKARQTAYDKANTEIVIV